jgi:ABC-type phosphate transport system substrate-binding protein
MRKHALWSRFAAALVCCGAVAGVGTGVAQAEFTPPYTTQCSGSTIGSLNTGLQARVASTWTAEFETFDVESPLACAGLGPEVNNFTDTTPSALEALGSVTGERNPSYRLASTEEPPTLAQWLRIDLGDKPGEDSGLIRQIPVASTAVTAIVRFPEGCPIPAGEATADGRFAVSNSALEKAYAGATATWGELLPDIASSCASLPIKRVVPEGSEGTTYVFKQWLATVNPSRGWAESSSLPNASWPKDSGATQTVRSTEGDRAEAQLVAGTSGSIGFASLPNARLAGFGAFSPENPRHKEGLFWLSLVNGAGARVEPTRDPHSGANNVLGANCDNPTFNYVPSGYDTTVTPVWRVVSAAGSKTGWPICTLSYFLAWDDASTVFGNTEPGQAEQRTAKDYLAYVLGSAGQEQAKRLDYSPLPSALLTDAEDGQSRIGWSKTVPGSKSTSIKAQIASAEEHSQS